MKVILLVCFGLLLVVTLGWSDTLTSKRNVRETDKTNVKQGYKTTQKKIQKSQNINKKHKNNKGKQSRHAKVKGRKYKKINSRKNTKKSVKPKSYKDNKTGMKENGKITGKGQRKGNINEKKRHTKIKTQRRIAKRKKTNKSKKRMSAEKSRQSCGDAQVDDTCVQNAIDSLNFEKNQIRNFFKQKARVQNHNKTTSSKKGKKGEFKDAAKYLLQAIGGNITAPICGGSARSVKSASDNYKTLVNCSNSIKEACNMPKGAFNATMKAKLDTCAEIFNKSKTAADDCRTNEQYTSNGTAACSCWAKAAIGINKARSEGCSATDTSKQANLEKMLVSRGGQYFVGNNLTWADLAVFQFTSDGMGGKPPKDLTAYPKISNLCQRVGQVPNIKNWMAARPVTNM